MSNKNDRTLAREYAFRFLYQYLFKKTPSPDVDDLKSNLADFNNSLIESNEYHLNQANSEYAKTVINEIFQNREEIESMIENSIDNWKMNRLSPVDMTILFVGIVEINFLDKKLPPKIAINEAINLAKKFGTEKSSAFVNGVLDKIAKEKGSL